MDRLSSSCESARDDSVRASAFRELTSATSTFLRSSTLPSLFELQASKFFIALAREPDRRRVLALIARHLKPWQTAYIGVIDPLDPRIDTPWEVCERVLEAAEYIPLQQLGTTDDCGFAPFSDDISTSRDTAFAKVRARVLGTRLASERLSARAGL